MKKNTLLFAGLLLFVCNYSFSQPYVAGESYFGQHDFIEYIAGNLPIVITAPHGGGLEPADIPDRDCDGCVYIRDAYTQELARSVAEAIHEQTGCYPHLILNLLHRKKLDANRAIDEAADGNPLAEQAWEDFHSFIASARAEVEADMGSGVYFDLHGHGHDIQRLELGYLLSSSKLRLADSELDANDLYKKTSVRALVERSGLSLSHFIRKEQSFGSLLVSMGYPAVPSEADPFPLQGQFYFTGGYNTRRYGSRDGGVFDGIQIECYHDIRFDAQARERFADSLARAMIVFYERNWNGFDIGGCGDNVGILEQADLGVEIFPNPVSDVFSVRSPRYPVAIRIFDSMGVLRKEVSVTGLTDELVVSGLQSGFYWVRAENQYGGVSTYKMLKMN